MREQMWRAVALFRVVTLAYTAVIIIRDHDRYAYPAAGLGALAIMTGWTVLSIVAYARPVGRRPWLIAADAIQARLGKYQQTAVLTLPIAGRQEDHPARPPAHPGHEDARSRARHQHDRAMARPRGHLLDTEIPPRRPDDQGTRTGPRHG